MKEMKMTKITNEQIDEIAESMPGGLEGFMKGWGWQQFARKLLGLQEQTILDLQAELAKVKKSRKKWRDSALSAEADAREAISDFGELQAEIKQNEVASTASLSIKVSFDEDRVKQMFGFVQCFAKSAEAMQKAASDAVESLNKMAMSGDFVKVEAGEEKQEQAAQTLTHNGKTYPVGVWIEWGGGKEAPIPDGVKHKVWFLTGFESSDDSDASSWCWRHVGNSADITAFMIL